MPSTQAHHVAEERGVPRDPTGFRRASDHDVAPHAAAADAQGCLPPPLLVRLGELGWWGALVPARDGGIDLDMTAFVALHEQVGRNCSSTRSLLGAHSMVAYAVNRWGSDTQRQNHLRALASGETVGAFCLTEPDAGSDAAAITATATPQDGGWVIDAHKAWITGGLIAGVFLIFARTTAGVSAFLIPRDAPGVLVEARPGLLGVRASMTADVTLERCNVPADALLGPEGFALPTVMLGALDVGRLSVAAGCVGIVQACLDAALDYSAHRRQGEVMLSDRQLVRRMIADMATDAHAARLLCTDAARLKDAGEPESVIATWRAKYFAARAARRAATDAVQIHGAAGCADDSIVARCYRDAKIMEVIEGSSEVQQLVIADDAYQTRR